MFRIFKPTAGEIAPPMTGRSSVHKFQEFHRSRANNFPLNSLLHQASEFHRGLSITAGGNVQSLCVVFFKYLFFLSKASSHAPRCDDGYLLILGSTAMRRSQPGELWAGKKEGSSAVWCSTKEQSTTAASIPARSRAVTTIIFVTHMAADRQSASLCS